MQDVFIYISISRLHDVPVAGIDAKISLPQKPLCAILGDFEIKTYYAIKKESENNLIINRKQFYNLY